MGLEIWVARLDLAFDILKKVFVDQAQLFVDLKPYILWIVIAAGCDYSGCHIMSKLEENWCLYGLLVLPFCTDSSIRSKLQGESNSLLVEKRNV